MKHVTKYLLIPITCVLFGSCAEDDRPASPPVFFDYKVWAEEGSPVTCTFQYRRRNVEGRTVSLHPSASVQFDGEELKAGHAGITGSYYEKVIPAEQFSGNHTVIFTDSAGRKFRERFTFRPFTLEEPLPSQLPLQPFSIRLKDISPGARVRLVMINTDADVNDVNTFLKPVDGVIHVSEQLVRQVGAGNIIVQITAEEERPLKSVTTAGGRLLTSYGIQREIVLGEGP
ncbi:MAG TPA: hypothetical protein VFZ78_10685 [Flavisolibacter sp.]